MPLPFLDGTHMRVLLLAFTTKKETPSKKDTPIYLVVCCFVLLLFCECRIICTDGPRVQLDFCCRMVGSKKTQVQELGKRALTPMLGPQLTATRGCSLSPKTWFPEPSGSPEWHFRMQETTRGGFAQPSFLHSLRRRASPQSGGY